MINRRYKRKVLRKKGKIYKRINQATVYYFRRTYQADNILFQTGEQHIAYAFQLSDLPNASEFTSLFDQYQIVGLKIKLVPNNTEITINKAYNGSTVVQTAAQGVPQCLSVIDYDDANVLSNKNEYLEYQNVRMFNVVTPHKRYFRPRVAVAVYQNPVTTGYGNTSRMWIDTTFPDVQHYGFKMYLDSSVSAIDDLIAYQMYVTYYLKFRGVR